MKTYFKNVCSFLHSGNSFVVVADHIVLQTAGSLKSHWWDFSVHICCITLVIPGVTCLDEIKFESFSKIINEI